MGLWAKALADSECSEEKAKSLYIKYRVQSIKDELILAEASKVKQKEREYREKQQKIENERIQQRRKDRETFTNGILRFIALLVAVPSFLIAISSIFAIKESMEVALFSIFFFGYVAYKSGQFSFTDCTENG